MLEQEDLGNPEVITAWLKENSGKADKTNARWFFEYGVKAKIEKRSGPAGKAFAESAVRYPTPQAINEYADLKLRMLGEIRARTAEGKRHWKSDLTSIAALYQSALAADAVLNTLGTTEKENTRKNAGCLATYVHTKKVQFPCPPLQTYGLGR